MDNYGVRLIPEVPEPEGNPMGSQQLFWPTLAIHPIGGAMLSEGWKPLFPPGFCKSIPVVLGLAITSLVVKMAENFFRKLFSGHFGHTPLVVPAVMVHHTGRFSSKFGQRRPIGSIKQVPGRLSRQRSRTVFEQVRAKTTHRKDQTAAGR